MAEYGTRLRLELEPKTIAESGYREKLTPCPETPFVESTIMDCRPDEMIRKLANLELHAVELAMAVQRVMPCMYEPTREAEERDGEIELTWRTIRVVTADLPTLLCMLGFLYRSKAGLDDGRPIPFACDDKDMPWLARLLPTYGPMRPAPERRPKPSEPPPKPLLG